jgi:cysteinyl-tRNA synthetase
MFLSADRAYALRQRVRQLLVSNKHTLISLIGNTALVELKKINPYKNVSLYAKLEGENPSGSLKDRIILYMLADVLESGELSPAKTIVESSSGNTGISLAMIGAALGLKILITMPDDVSIERRKLIQSFGAQLVLTPGELGTDGAIEEARRLIQTNKNYLWIAQHYNPVNSFAHYETTGAEIIQQLETDSISVFVGTSGTTGSLMGISAKLKETFPRARVIAIWPKEKIMGLRRPEGKSRPGIYDESYIDQILELEEAEAVSMAAEVARREGLLLGPSGGAAVLGALRQAETLKNLETHSTIVTLIPDRGERYLSLG